MPFRAHTWNPRIPFDPAKLPFFYGWVILVVSTLGIVSSIPGQTMGVSVYTDIFIAELGLSRTQLTVSYMVGTAISGFILPLGGRLFDRMGARGFFTASSLFFGLALLAMSQIDRIAGVAGSLFGGGWWVAALVVCIGFLGIRFLGQGMVTMGSRSMLMKWFNRRRGMVTAISGVSTAFAFSFAPKILDEQIELFGWRGSYIFNAIVLCGGMAVVALIFFRDNPEECGLVMDGETRSTEADEARNPDLVMRRDFTLAESLRTYSFWVITIMLGLQALFATAYTFHVVDIGRVSGIERDEILNYFWYCSIFSVTTNILAGIAIDFVRLRYIVITMGLAGAAMGLGIVLLPSMAGKVTLIVGMGVSWGCFPLLTSVSYARYFGRAHIGAISGFSMSFLVWGSAVGPFVFSLSRDFAGGYNPIVIAGAALYLVFAISAIWAENPQRKLA